MSFVYTLQLKMPTLASRAWGLLCALLLLCAAAASPPARADAIQELYNDALAQVQRRLDDRVLDLRLRNVEQDIQERQVTVEQIRKVAESSVRETRPAVLMRGLETLRRMSDTGTATLKRWVNPIGILSSRLTQAANREMDRQKSYKSETADVAQYATVMRSYFKAKAYGLLMEHFVKTDKIFQRLGNEFDIVSHALVMPVNMEAQANLEAIGMGIDKERNDFMEKELRFIEGMYETIASIGGG